MNKNNKRIYISFINPAKQIYDNHLFLSMETIKFLTKKQIEFLYSEESTLKDLFFWMVSNTITDDISFDDEFLNGQIKAYIDEQVYNVNLSFNLENYIKYNSINNTLFFQYSIGTGAGWGGNINESIRIFLTNDESEHKNEPHVHVQKGRYHDSKYKEEYSRKLKKENSYDNTIRIRLSDLEIMDATPEKKHFFTRKEIKIVRKFLQQYREQFIENYNMLYRGIKPLEAYLDINGKEVLFK